MIGSRSQLLPGCNDAYVCGLHDQHLQPTFPPRCSQTRFETETPRQLLTNFERIISTYHNIVSFTLQSLQLNVDACMRVVLMCATTWIIMGYAMQLKYGISDIVIKVD